MRVAKQDVFFTATVRICVCTMRVCESISWHSENILVLNPQATAIHRLGICWLSPSLSASPHKRLYGYYLTGWLVRRDQDLRATKKQKGLSMSFRSLWLSPIIHPSAPQKHQPLLCFQQMRPAKLWCWLIPSNGGRTSQSDVLKIKGKLRCETIMNISVKWGLAKFVWELVARRIVKPESESFRSLFNKEIG